MFEELLQQQAEKNKHKIYYYIISMEIYQIMFDK